MTKRNRNPTRNAIRPLAAILGAAAVVLFAQDGAAEAPAVCAAPQLLDKYRLLRRLSLDLRNRPPSIEEYEALDGSETVPEEVVRSFLASDDFRVAMRRHHENQLWPNIQDVPIGERDNDISLQISESPGLSIEAHESVYRGGNKAFCDDVLQTEFDLAHPGEYRPIGARVDGQVIHEGYRLVHPYWAPETTIKVCAFDAQETLSTKVKGKTVACGTLEATDLPECGCGPNLRSCFAPKDITSDPIKRALREQLGRLVDRVTTGAAPYSDLLLAQDVEENGPIAFWRKHLMPNARSARFRTTFNTSGEPTNDLPFTDATTWLPVRRTTVHAGILTLPAYLLRFQTQRSRANRFRAAFMGQFFVPPAELVAQAGCSTDAPDLTKRCHCQYCHQTLEPLAASFGAFAEAGSAYLDPTTFPREDPSCVGKEKGSCARLYEARPDGARPGWLAAYQFADAHPDYVDSIERGPRKLAESIVADGTFAKTVVRNLYARLVKREMRVGGEEVDDAALLDSLASSFVASQYDFPGLVARVVALPEYRSVR